MADEAAWQQPYSLEEASQKFFNGSIKARALGNAVRQGLLEAELIAGKLHVTERGLIAYRKASKITKTKSPKPPKESPCPDQGSPPASGSGAHATSTKPPGSFATDRARLARAQAQRILEQLKKPSKTTLPTDTSPQVVQLPQKPS